MLRSQMSSLRQVMRQMLAYVLDWKEKIVRVCKLHFECFENVVLRKHIPLNELNE